MRVLEQDARVQGGVYLCQASDCLSCGGCCGLYNVQGLTREALRAMLWERTRRFAAVPRTIAGIDAFAQERMAVEGTAYPDPSLHHCLYVGLIEEPQERVGCLLHPLARGNGGVDWRGLSYYGGATCALFFCPTYSAVPARWKFVAREVLDDWFAYGLIIVEHRLLAALFGELEFRLGWAVDGQGLSQASRAAVAELVRLKLTWPFRTPGVPLGRNFFSITDIPRPACVVPGASERMRTVLGELDTASALASAALEHLNAVLARTVAALRADGPAGF